MTGHRLVRAHRGHPAYWAFVAHRLSGLLLAIFLPFHFLALALALDGAARLDGFLRWTDALPVKLAEMGLVVLLAVHLTGGLRILAIEFLPWRDWHKTLVALCFGLSLLGGLAFLISAS